MRETVTWTNLTKTEIAERLGKTSMPVSVNIVTQLLDDAKFHRRKLRKILCMGGTPTANASNPLEKIICIDLALVNASSERFL